MNAFPSKAPISENCIGSTEHTGMKLRDYFAAKAMQTLVIDTANIYELARESYRIADVMIEERKNYDNSRVD